MDIVRAFTDSGMTNDVYINIQGTPDDPLFQANQIGALLGLVNIHESIKDFDDDEKRVTVSTDSVGRRQSLLFLTEFGVYRLLGASRKPCARPFQKWVGRVVKEIRLNGKYETEQRLSLAVQALDANRNAAEKARHDALIACNDNVSCVYVVIVLIGDTWQILKFGETDNIKTRMMGLKALYKMAILIDVFAIGSAHSFEQDLLHTPLFVEQKYDGLVNGHRGAEFFVADKGHTYKDFFRPIIRRKFEDHKKMQSTIEDRRLRIDERRLCLDKQRLELARSVIQSSQLQPAQIAEIVMNVFRPIVADSDTLPESPSGDLAPPRETFHAHRPTDKRVQQYDKNLAFVAVHEGLREAARAVAGGRSSGIRTACVTNALYLGYRWHLVDRNDRSGVPCDALVPTAPPKRRSGMIAQLPADKNDRTIVKVHEDQVAAAESVGLAKSSSITTALKRMTTAGGYRWARLDDCSEVMRSAWDKANGGAAIPTRVCHRGRKVHRLDPETGALMHTYNTMSEACIDLALSHAQLHKASRQQTEYCGFRWRVQ